MNDREIKSKKNGPVYLNQNLESSTETAVPYKS